MICRVFKGHYELSLMCGTSMCDQLGWGNGRSVINITISYTISYRGSNGREATVTERAARSNPQRAVGEAHCELYVSQKVIDAHLKALSTPWWTESSYFSLSWILCEFVSIMYTVSSQKKGPSRFFWEVDLPVENRRAIWRTFREHEN